jgi:RNA polymerase sigma-70 factor (ECF subfamily)
VGDPVHVDKALAGKILAGDEQAFRAMFERFFPRLYRYALARLDGDGEAARDVVQDTFRKAIERLDSYRGEAALYAWFCRICRNTLLDYCRARSREPVTVTLIEDRGEVRGALDFITAPLLEAPASAAAHRDLRRLVQAVLDRLPPRYGDVLEWKYVEGLSVKEIATRLESTPKAAESLLTRARNAFREAIGAVGAAVDTDYRMTES